MDKQNLVFIGIVAGMSTAVAIMNVDVVAAMIALVSYISVFTDIREDGV